MNFESLKIRMDGQEHELQNFEVDMASRSIMFDFDDTVCIHLEEGQELFSKELQLMKVGCDDEFVKAKIDSVFVEENSKENKILSVSF